MTKETFDDWKSSQSTQAILSKLEERRKEKEELMVELAAGCTSVETLSLQAARLAGMVIGLNEILELTWEDM